MIESLAIKHFKSIKLLDNLPCRRINIFIGEPNSGKSNILEALGLFSYGGYYKSTNPKEFVRFERVSNLFYDENLDEKVRIELDSVALELEFKGGVFWGRWLDGGSGFAHLGGSHNTLDFGGDRDRLLPFKFYRFASQQSFRRQESEFLLPPSGTNLLSLLLTHKELRATANRLFSRFGFRLGLRPQEGKIEVVKQIEDIIISYPYSLTSDTLQRLVFYLCAVLSNRDSVLVFEEPEAHAFPYYTKYLAETIAAEQKNNQYFISTHNPYFLLPLLEKSPKEELAIFLTYFQEYQTKFRVLSQEEMAEITEIDVFANLDRFLASK